MKTACLKALAVVVVTTVFSFPSAAQQQATGFNPLVPSPEAEIALGRELARQFEQDVKLLDDPSTVEYVNRVGQNVVKNSDANVPFTIKVIDSSEVNAMGLPGAFLYVNAGLIQAADNEAQLAAVISHVVAHVAARHAAKQTGKASFLNILSLPSTAFPNAALQQPPSPAPVVPAMFYGFSRAAEFEADSLGLQYLYKAGYDPGAMGAILQKMAAPIGGGRTVSALFKTHPATEDRLAKALDLERTLPARQQNTVDTTEFQDIKKRLP